VWACCWGATLQRPEVHRADGRRALQSATLGRCRQCRLPVPGSGLRVCDSVLSVAMAAATWS
jgi:hypothetical protein